MSTGEEFLNGIPWELCCMTSLALRLRKPFSELGDELSREKSVWLERRFIPHAKGDLLRYLRAGSWPLRNCDRCGQPQCRSYPSCLWHLLRPGKVFSLTSKGFGLQFLCHWCMEQFTPSEHELAIFSPHRAPVNTFMPPVPAPAPSEINLRWPTVVKCGKARSPECSECSANRGEREILVKFPAGTACYSLCHSCSVKFEKDSHSALPNVLSKRKAPAIG